jgi:hypothetical protein
VADVGEEDNKLTTMLAASSSEEESVELSSESIPGICGHRRPSSFSISSSPSSSPFCLRPCHFH